MLAWPLVLARGGAIAPPTVSFTVLLTVLFAGLAVPIAQAQNITLDGSLGPQQTLTGPIYLIRQADGRRVGGNLFHSFGRFNLDAGEAALFDSGPNIRHILGRVSGGTPSQIDGIIATARTDVNLFLMNPNGIIFGPNAQLAVGGAFVATTADSIELGDRGLFRANPRAASSLLRVAPGALLFNQLNPAPIINRSVAPNLTNPAQIDGLRVIDGQSLLLVGGPVQLDGGVVQAVGGYVGLAGARGVGRVELYEVGDRLRLSVAGDTPRADITLRTGGAVNVAADGEGNIDIAGRNIRLLNGTAILAGIAANSGGASRVAGDITIGASHQVLLGGATGPALTNLISNSVAQGGQGRAGQIRIRAAALDLQNNAQIGSLTSGRGSAGLVRLRIDGPVALAGANSSIFSVVAPAAVDGDGATIDLRGRSLSLTNGAQIATSTLGRGNAGDIVLRIDDTVQIRNGAVLRADTFARGDAGNVVLRAGGNVSIDGSNNGVASSIVTLVGQGPGFVGIGTGGNITLQAENLRLSRGGQLNASTLSQGNAGNVRVRVNRQIAMDGVYQGSNSGIQSNVEAGAGGDGGNIRLWAESIAMTDGAQIQTLVRRANGGLPAGQGQGGIVDVRVRRDLRLDGVARRSSGDGSTVTLPSLIASNLDLRAAGRAGGIRIRGGSLTLSDGAQLNSSTAGRGDAGPVRVNVQGAIILDGINQGFNSGIQSNVEFAGRGDGGDIRLRAGTMRIADGAQIQTLVRRGNADFPAGRGQAGDIVVRVEDDVTLSGAGRILNPNGSTSLQPSLMASTLDVGATGGAGQIQIWAGSLRFADGAQLNSSTAGRGSAGDVAIWVRDHLALEGRSGNFTSSIQSNVESDGMGRGGNLQIRAGSMTMNNGAQLQTLVRRAGGSMPAGRGRAGNVDVQVRHAFTMDAMTNPAAAILDLVPSLILSSLDQGARGRAGDIRIQAHSMAAFNGAQLNSSTAGQGNAGSVRVETQGSLVLDGVNQLGFGSSIQSNVEAGGVGNGGNIHIRAGSMALQRGAQLQTLVRETDESLPAGRGRAGAVQIWVTDALTLEGVGDVTFAGQTLELFPSLISSSLNPGAEGRAGDIRIRAGSVALQDGAAILSTTFGRGDAGTIDLEVTDDVQITGRTVRRVGGFNLGYFNTISSQVAENAAGNGGDITVQGNRLSLDDFSVLATSSAGRGNAGDVTVRMADAITLLGGSNIRSGIEAGGEGQGGNITLAGRSLSVRGGSQVSALLFRQVGALPGGRGQGGNITVQATESVDLVGTSTVQLPVVNPLDPLQMLPTAGFSSGLFTNTERGAQGPAGNITVTAQNVRVRDGALVDALTSNRGRGGSITINANRFEASGGGQVITTTRSAGQAGDMVLNVGDRLLVSGRDPTFRQRLRQFGDDVVNNQGAASGLLANTARGSTGQGGNIFIDPRLVLLQNSAIVAANSAGSGAGGSIRLQAGTLILDRGAAISAATTTNTGGNINLDVERAVVMRRGSTISTEAGTAQAGGNGGNISISSAFVMAVAAENSDINANAFEGNGGNIDITTQGLLGLTFRPAPTSFSDITASSRFGVDGSVTINRPDIDPSRGLAELPVDLADASRQIVQGCSSGDRDLGDFFVTGRGGLPPQPYELLSPDGALPGWVTPVEAAGNSETGGGAEVEPGREADGAPETTALSEAAPQWVEAQSWRQDPQGRVVLMAQSPPSALPTSMTSSSTQENCHVD